MRNRPALGQASALVSAQAEPQHGQRTASRPKEGIPCRPLRSPTACSANAAWTAEAERQHGQRKADGGTHPDGRKGYPRRPLQERGMDRRSRAPARTAESGRRRASRPKGGIPPPLRSPTACPANAAWTAEAERQHGQRKADGGKHPDRREGYSHRLLRERGMDRRSRAPARTAESGRRKASRPKGGILPPPAPRTRHGPQKPSASTDSGKRTAERIPTEGRDTPSARTESGRSGDLS